MDLVICYTPLHAIIIKRLVEEKKLEKFFILYLNFQRNDKHDYYFNEVAKLSCASKSINLRRNPVFDFLALSLFYARNRRRFHSLWVGNLKQVYSRLLALLYDIEAIITFDDGGGNIAGTGYLYNLEENRPSSFLLSVLGRDYLYKNVIQKIIKHYTIYDLPNVYDYIWVERCHLNLIKRGEGGYASRRGMVVIFLESAFASEGLWELSKEIQVEEKCLDIFDVDLYIPHPRSSKKLPMKERQAKRVESKLIAEDFIYALGSQYQEIVVYGCYSSVLLNLYSVEGIKVANVKTEINEATKALDLVFERLGIENVKLD